MDEAALLMDRPPGGWGDLATTRALDALEGRIDRRFAEVDRRFTELEERFDLKLETLEHKLVGVIDAGFRAQTWRLATALFAAMGMLAAIVRL